MKNSNKKGFTLVELVIVIAVIAILAAVLIPTFSGIIEKANKSARLQKARNAYTTYYADLDATDLASEIDLVITVDTNYFYTVSNNQFIDNEYTVEATAKAALKYGEGNTEYTEWTNAGTYNTCTIKKGTVPTT